MCLDRGEPNQRVETAAKQRSRIGKVAGGTLGRRKGPASQRAPAAQRDAPTHEASSAASGAVRVVSPQQLAGVVSAEAPDLARQLAWSRARLCAKIELQAEQNCNDGQKDGRDGLRVEEPHASIATRRQHCPLGRLQQCRRGGQPLEPELFTRKHSSVVSAFYYGGRRF